MQDANLTARERQRLEYQRQVYQLAKQKKETEDALKRNDDYRMPDSYDPDSGAHAKRYDVLTQRFRCADFSPVMLLRPLSFAAVSDLLWVSTEVPPQPVSAAADALLSVLASAIAVSELYSASACPGRRLPDCMHGGDQSKQAAVTCMTGSTRHALWLHNSCSQSLPCRDNEDEGEELTPWGEQAAWEAHQVRHTPLLHATLRC